MRGRSKFGRICGVRTKLWKMFSITYSDWQLTRINGCVMFGRMEERWEVGILCFQDTLTIGKWKRWRACFEKSILWFCIVMWRMSWVRRLARMAHFLLDLSTVPSHMPLVNLFLWALFGDLGLPWELAFVLGKHFGTEFWPWISLKEGVGIYQIDVICVKWKRKLVTTWSFSVKRPQCYGACFSPFLMCSGSCIPQSKGIW